MVVVVTSRMRRGLFGTVVRRMTATSALACMVALGSVTASAGPVRAQEWGTVTFRLTIRGEVDPADAFWLVLQPTSGEVPMRSGGFLAGGPDFFCLPDEPIGFPHGSRPGCAAGDYERSCELPVGTEIEYSFERFDDQLVRRPDGHLPEPMPILAGTVLDLPAASTTEVITAILEALSTIERDRRPEPSGGSSGRQW